MAPPPLPPRGPLFLGAVALSLLAATALAPRPVAADGPIVQTIFYYSPPPPSAPFGPGVPAPATTAAPPPPAPAAPRAAARNFSPPKYQFMSGSAGGRAGFLVLLRLPLLCAATAILACCWRY